VVAVAGAGERRGLIRQSDEGYRLHDGVRRILSTAHSGGRTLPSPLLAGRPLSSQRDSEAMLEGARLLLNDDALEQVISLLKEYGTMLIEGGYAPASGSCSSWHWTSGSSIGAFNVPWRWPVRRCSPG